LRVDFIRWCLFAAASGEAPEIPLFLLTEAPPMLDHTSTVINSFFHVDCIFSQIYSGCMERHTATVEGILGPDGLLAASLDGFEFRPAQLQMALRIDESLKRKVPVIVEAGTGTGKTFGYLVPIILSHKKAVISTGTKNLQEQIYFKDLRLLKESTGVKLDAMMMKGRKNYLCLHKYHQFFSQRSLPAARQGHAQQRLEEWRRKTEFADRAELDWLADDDPLWDALSSTSDQCLGSDCLHMEDCYLGRLRSKAAKSKIIIVNHHLFFADLKVKKGGFGEIIPRFQVAVFDEAHNIEEIATSYLGESLSTSQLVDLIIDLEKEIKNFPKSDAARLKKLLNAIRTAAEHLRGLLNDPEDKGRLPSEILLKIRKGPARAFSGAVRAISQDGSVVASGSAVVESLVSRGKELESIFDQIVSEKDNDWLKWFEKRKRTVVLHASPLDISRRMDRLLYQKLPSVVVTSATLSTNGTFAYIRSRLGLPDHTLEGIYPPYFDFQTQTLMYIPSDLPLPGTPEFAPAAAKKIADILQRTDGRALVLFTSYHNLNIAYGILKDTVPYTLHRQGDGPRSVLLDAFMQNIHSVLLATGSFWQGVDVPGETLSCLIVDKLPFDSPGEPLVSARIDLIREAGGNPFLEYQVPSAIISLKQGLGRLIRKRSDWGLLSVLDRRLITSRYGKLFLDSLPDIPVTHKVEDISSFFEAMKGTPACLANPGN
jgi:ATP-dependent DNA helicase DinG